MINTQNLNWIYGLLEHLRVGMTIYVLAQKCGVLHVACVVSEIVWITGLYKELGEDLELLGELYYDSKGTLQIAANPVYHERTKHIEIDCHFIWEKIQMRLIKPLFLRTHEQQANILTKGLIRSQHEYLVSKLGVLDVFIPSSLRGSNGTGVLQKDWIPAHLLELLETHLIDLKAFSDSGHYPRIEGFSHYSAMELQRTGICFKPGKSRVEFNAYLRSAVLALPPITINDSTKSEFLNLVAYEACPDTPDDFRVTSYICFIRSLIDNAEDHVKELRSKSILLNFFGTDEEVADLFKEIARNLVPNPHAFVDVKYKIEEHCSSRRKAWIAELRNTHFASPWTFLAFIAALFVISLQVAGLVLSAFQTYYTAHEKKGS
ncbi:hypothetical protein BC332_11811 [Capsicum chinense]|nr:hypothetical protein BC332_11811 [Capsicum chinense]